MTKSMKNAFWISVGLIAVCVFILAPLSKDPSDFYSATLSYFGDLRDAGIKADLAMLGGSNPLEIEAALRSAKEKENSSYLLYLNRRATSAGIQDLTAQVDEVHQAFQDSIGELILGSEGRDLERMRRGGDAFKHSLELADAAIARINELRRAL